MIFAILSNFNNILGYSYAPFGIQKRKIYLHFNQHSITFLGILMRHSAYKREKYAFICVNIQVVNTILKVNKDNSQTLKFIKFSLYDGEPAHRNLGRHLASGKFKDVWITEMRPEPEESHCGNFENNNCLKLCTETSTL